MSEARMSKEARELGGFDGHECSFVPYCQAWKFLSMMNELLSEGLGSALVECPFCISSACAYLNGERTCLVHKVLLLESSFPSASVADQHELSGMNFPDEAMNVEYCVFHFKFVTAISHDCMSKLVEQCQQYVATYIVPRILILRGLPLAVQSF